MGRQGDTVDTLLKQLDVEPIAETYGNNDGPYNVIALTTEEFNNSFRQLSRGYPNGYYCNPGKAPVDKTRLYSRRVNFSVQESQAYAFLKVHLTAQSAA